MNYQASRFSFLGKLNGETQVCIGGKTCSDRVSAEATDVNT